MKPFVLFATLVTFLAGSLPFTAVAESKSIRFYELHKRDGEKRMRAKNTDEAGCHNFKRDIELHRVGLIGFAWCTVYSEKNCAEGSEIPALWAGKRYRLVDFDTTKPQIRLLRGSRWEFTDKALILDNDARRYHDKTRALQQKERKKALEELREAIKNGEAVDSSFFAAAKSRAKKRISKGVFGRNKKDDDADEMIEVDEKDVEMVELTPEEKLEKLEALEAEIAEIEQDYIAGLQRNVMAASWYCEAK